MKWSSDVHHTAPGPGRLLNDTPAALVEQTFLWRPRAGSAAASIRMDQLWSTLPPVLSALSPLPIF